MTIKNAVEAHLALLDTMTRLDQKNRDHKGYWVRIKKNITDHSQAEFSLGICRECSQKRYPNLNITDYTSDCSGPTSVFTLKEKKRIRVRFRYKPAPGALNAPKKTPRTVINEGDYGGCYFWVVKGIFDVIQEEFAAIMMDRLEETRQWLEDERRRIDKKYAELLASQKRLQGRLVKKF